MAPRGLLAVLARLCAFKPGCSFCFWVYGFFKKLLELGFLEYWLPTT